LIADHGNSVPGTGQQVGDVFLTPPMAEDLRPLLADDATVTLGGCHIGRNAAYCNSIAVATGATVVGSDDTVYYPGWRLFLYDYYSVGDWITYPGDSNDAGNNTIDGKDDKGSKLKWQTYTESISRDCQYNPNQL